MKRRIFIAINLSESVRKGIARATAPLIGAMPNYRFLQPEWWHITLLFLGSQDDDMVARTIDVLNNVIIRFPEPMIELTEFSLAPTAARPRMIWARGSEATAVELAPVQELLKNSLDQAGVRFENKEKRFCPHVTVARLKKGLPAPPATVSFPKINLSFHPEAVECWESNLAPGKAKYRALSFHRFNDF